jgi:hypothetical protein
LQGTPGSDGVPGLGQAPIEPGGSYLYKYEAYPAGTYWHAKSRHFKQLADQTQYHSHSPMALLDGFYGGQFVRYAITVNLGQTEGNIEAGQTLERLRLGL